MSQKERVREIVSQPWPAANSKFTADILAVNLPTKVPQLYAFEF